MGTIAYKIRLITDAEPGSGLGTELVDSLVPRSPGLRPRPMVAASHVKGLVRTFLESIETLLGPRGLQVIASALGAEGDAGSDGIRGRSHFTDAVVSDDTSDSVRTISRTALGPYGGSAKLTARFMERPYGKTCLSIRSHEPVVLRSLLWDGV